MQGRRAEIAEVAAQVIADDGLERTSMREIAGRMGVTVGTLTHQFRNREDLLRTTFELTVEAIRRRAVSAMTGKQGVDLLRAILVEGLPSDETRRVEVSVWLAFAASAARNDEHRRLYRRLYLEWEEGLASVVAGLCDGRARDPRRTARILIAVADGIALRALAEDRFSHADQERLLVAAVTAIMGANGA